MSKEDKVGPIKHRQGRHKKMELSIDMIYDMMKWKWGICNPDFKSFTLNVDDKEEKKEYNFVWSEKGQFGWRPLSFES